MKVLLIGCNGEIPAGLVALPDLIRLLDRVEQALLVYGYGVLTTPHMLDDPSPVFLYDFVSRVERADVVMVIVNCDSALASLMAYTAYIREKPVFLCLPESANLSGVFLDANGTFQMHRYKGQDVEDIVFAFCARHQILPEPVGV